MNIGEKIREITVVPRVVPIPQRETVHVVPTEQQQQNINKMLSNVMIYGHGLLGSPYGTP